MKNRDVKSIVIVGGGSAGWMAAATLINFFPDKQVVIIDSSSNSSLGVGESTLGHINYWMYALGIEEKDFLVETDASLKLSIKFTDFYEKDYGHYHYPFGNIYIDDKSYNQNTWLLKKIFHKDTSSQDYVRTFFPAMSLIEKNKISNNFHGRFENFDLKHDAAYHFDAKKFAKWLKEKYCIPRGVKHIDANVEHVIADDDGITEVMLDNELTVTGDLFVDCTGWKSMLLGSALGVKFNSYSDLLPNNKAWATKIPYVDKEKEIEPYTNCTAIDNGWVWNIPLWSRIGTGYVYSDKYISDEEALEQFKNHLRTKTTLPNEDRISDDLEFKNIKMRIGIHDKTWHKNVVAIGLSAGFIEPLESNGLFTVHEFLLSLVDTLSRDKISQWDIDAYNERTFKLYDGFAKFVALHYKLSVRQDTPYWRDITTRETPRDRILEDCDFRKALDAKNDKDGNHEKGGWHCIANGMNYHTLTITDIMKREFEQNREDTEVELSKIISRWDSLKSKWDAYAEEEPSLFNYLRENYYGDVE